ncbi:hypothetical protein LLEC1_06193 [Akanthomyces lecanii]|uniref:Uncharacterized protein n=1 Tax=Cordyceps confragosa TaxID=2714763 RepID=A0A179I520_CORDF|nr:hypothetical protein LLEC1_06193 [Akanthomyces lecanii]
MASIVEFYIACNPPLLPRGVTEVIRRVQGAEGLLEILYEPQIPWFKCVALPKQRQKITAAVQDNLFAIAEEDVDTLDVEEKTDGDVSIISDDPRMTPWSEYCSKGSNAYKFADGDVFPDPIAEAKYKTTWRGLEEHPALTFQELLKRSALLCGGDSPKDHEQFEAQTSCRVSYNTRQTLLYIGSDQSRETIELAVEKVDSMAQAYGKHWHEVLPALLPPLEVLPLAEFKEVLSHDPFEDIPCEVNSALQDSIKPTVRCLEPNPDPFGNLKSLL